MSAYLLDQLNESIQARKDLQPIVDKYASKNDYDKNEVLQVFEKTNGILVTTSELMEQIMNKNYRTRILIVKNGAITGEIPFDKIPGKGWDYNKATEFARSRKRV